MQSAKFATTFKRSALKLALVSAFAIGASAIGVNTYAAEGTGTANATVVAPITIGASNPNLRFGSFSTSGAGQTVAIDAAGNRTLTGVLGVGTGQNAFGAASFAVGGGANLTYAITLPSTVNITTGAQGPTETMAVSNFVSNPTTGTGGTLSAGGAQTLTVGATLTTVANQVVGTYSGTFIVTVAYN